MRSVWADCDCIAIQEQLRVQVVQEHDTDLTDSHPVLDEAAGSGADGDGHCAATVHGGHVDTAVKTDDASLEKENPFACLPISPCSICLSISAKDARNDDAQTAE